MCVYLSCAQYPWQCYHSLSLTVQLLQVEEKRKYAKWKAVDIDKCLKNGITPTPGPPGGDDSEFTMGLSGGMGSGPPGGMGSGPPGGMGFGPPIGGVWIGYPGDLNQPGGSDLDPSGSGYNPSSIGQDCSQPVPKPRSIPPNEAPSASRGTGLPPEQLERVTKLCKFAISSLDYEDKDGAIENLTKALHLLKTGKEI